MGVEKTTRFLAFPGVGGRMGTGLTTGQPGLGYAEVSRSLYGYVV